MTTLGTRRLGSVALAVLLAAAATHAAPPAVPEGVTYQGVLLDSAGEPRTGTVDLTIRLYDDPTGGTLLYKQSFSGVPLSEGVFTVELGPAGVASDSPEDPLTTSLAAALAGDLAGTAPGRFVEVTVGSSGALARTQILAAPFALRAESAAAADFATDAGTAQTALDSSSLAGLDGDLFTQIYEHVNLDGTGPGNTDPAEGTADTDGDGAQNFVDADNDGDGLSDGDEVSRGSGINLVTPTLASVEPDVALNNDPVTITVTGTSLDDPALEGGVGGVLGPAVSTAPGEAAFVVDPQPAAEGLDVSVRRGNGETGALAGAFTFLDGSIGIGVHDVASRVRPPFDISTAPDGRFVLSGLRSYGVDDDADSVPERDFALGSANNGQVDVAFDPSGALAGVRCRAQGNECVLELLRDSDADLELEDETGTPIASLSLATNPSVTNVVLAFDSSGRAAVAWTELAANPPLELAHDLDGDGAFETDEKTAVTQSFDDGSGIELGFGPTDVLWLLYHGSGQLQFRRDLDRDLDLLGEASEVFSISTATPDCIGLARAPSGQPFIVDGSSAGLSVLQDFDGDGLPDSRKILLEGSFGECDLFGGGAPVVYSAVTEDGSTVMMGVDANEDADLDDAGELATEAGLGPIEQVASGRDAAGRALVATGASLLEDRRILLGPAP